MKDLIFSYPSTAKIRFKREHCLYCDDYPYIYRIKTKRLDFTIPKVMVLLLGKNVYIPLDYYKRVLTKFYTSIKK